MKDYKDFVLETDNSLIGQKKSLGRSRSILLASPDKYSLTKSQINILRQTKRDKDYYEFVRDKITKSKNVSYSLVRVIYSLNVFQDDLLNYLKEKNTTKKELPRKKL